jgi:hypothetical protein
MNLRPAAAFLHGVSIAPRSSGLGLPRVIAFPLLLFDRPDSNSKAALFFFRTAETPLATIRHRGSEIQRESLFWCQDVYRELSQFHSQGTSHTRG